MPTSQKKQPLPHLPADVTARRAAAKRRSLFFALAGIILVADYLTKAWVVATIPVGETHTSWGILHITHVLNSGAAFSLGEKFTVAITIISMMIISAVASALWRATNAAWATGLALILGGAFGNLYDRLFRPPAPFSGHVVDFISVGKFPVFNIADSAVTIGVIIVVICIIGGKKLTGVPRQDGSTTDNAQVSGHE
ncbi:signal peptidase II [Lawsonella clevelandensis]|uniref:Lipoprotein signal peptidase n=1 Tax=Lawsonella clevelandensis TaxID=1528099 RepID=A0A5E3ZYU2_9ACTN|nr:signal peptidase II [Lawsonella clevelandensis]MDU7193688.1 signal peptidase II [Lawsonella clevelandensis]VHO01651.1 Lipoprotein signal peptidase [Lawsonella clevelandensis]